LVSFEQILLAIYKRDAALITFLENEFVFLLLVEVKEEVHPAINIKK